MEGLYSLTQAKEIALSHREAMLVENSQIFANQYLRDWEEISKELAKRIQEAGEK